MYGYRHFTYMVAYTGTAEGRAWSHRVDEPIIYVSKLLLLLLLAFLFTRLSTADFRNDHVIWLVEERQPPSQERHHFLPSGDKTSSKVIYRSVDLCHPATPLLLLTAVLSYLVTQPAFYCPYRAIGSNPLKSRSTSTNTRCQLRHHKFLQLRQVEVGLPIPHHHLPPPT